MLIDRLIMLKASVNNLVCRCLVGRETIHAVQTVLTLLQCKHSLHCTTGDFRCKTPYTVCHIVQDIWDSCM